MIRTYEVLYIVKPTILDDDVTEIVDALASVAEENGAKILSKGKWDRRDLAYEINGYAKGCVYCLMYLEGEGNIPAVITREFRINDDILRGMVTVVDTRFVDTSKIEGPKQNAEKKESAAPKPSAVIGTEEEREGMKAGEIAVTEKGAEVVEEANEEKTEE